MRRGSFVLAFALGACGGGGDGGAGGIGGGGGGGGGGGAGGDSCDPTVRTFEVPDFSEPFEIMHIEVDPAATGIDPVAYPQSRHQLYVATEPGVTLREELFVMLPGTDNLGQAFSHIGELAARAGYPTITLAYESSTHPSGICSSAGSEQEEIDCRTAVVAEKAFGVDLTDAYPGDEQNSIEGRLLRLLQFIDAQRPEVGADRFFDADGVRWDKIVVAGFSQGAMQAGYIGKERALARNILFAGGCDALDPLDASTLLPWCFEPRATPAERTWAVMHRMDEAVPGTPVHEAYGLLDLGGYGDAAHASPDYCTHPHALETDLESQDNDHKYHLSVAHDGEIPVDENDVAVLAEDYYYLMTAQ